MDSRKGGGVGWLPDTNDGSGFDSSDSFEEAKGFSFLGVRVR
jgi:hypothetical protein